MFTTTLNICRYIVGLTMPVARSVENIATMRNCSPRPGAYQYR